MNLILRLTSLVTMSVCLSVSGFQAGVAGVHPGDRAPAFTLQDLDGRKHSLQQYLTQECTVIMFIATQCPISNDYNDRMVDLHNRYGEKSVTFLGINSNRQESLEEVHEHATKYGLAFAILKDHNNVVADAYGAQVTPEVFVVDSEGIVRYHGRIDDSRDPDDILRHDLVVALDELLAGRKITTSTTRAFGCAIKKVKK